MEENKKIACIVSSTVRDLIKKANSMEIKKEDIISIFPLEGQIYLTFYM